MARSKRKAQAEAPAAPEADVVIAAPAQVEDPAIAVDVHPGQPGIIVTKGDAILWLDEGNARGWFIDPVTRAVFEADQLALAWSHFQPQSAHFVETDAGLAYAHDPDRLLPLVNAAWRPSQVTLGEPVTAEEAASLPPAVVEVTTTDSDGNTTVEQLPLPDEEKAINPDLHFPDAPQE